jgi:hypothetical protein
LTPEGEIFSGKYDDASWHHGGDFPKALPIDAGGTHTGMFLAWAILSGLGGELHEVDLPERLEELRSRAVTPGAFFMKACDGKFTDEDLNDQGNAYAQEYYAIETGQYIHDYEAALGGELPDLYHIADSWENFERIKPVLDRRYEEWNDEQSAGSKAQ